MTQAGHRSIAGTRERSIKRKGNRDRTRIRNARHAIATLRRDAARELNDRSERTRGS